MLEITVPKTELYDESTNAFLYVNETTLQLEHSLLSISKWERKWCKPFLHTNDKTTEETIDYIQCMTITKKVDQLVYKCLTPDNLQEINEYINAPMTATTFSDNTGAKNREIVTAEILYYQMIELNIPIEFQKWHLNSLIALIRVCAIKKQPPKKMSKSEIIRRNSEINDARRKRFKSKG